MGQDKFHKWSIILQALTFIFAAIIGFSQLSINSRLKNLQDYVAISIVPGKEYFETADGKLVNNFIKVTNTGKSNIYLYKYEITDIKSESFTKPILVPIGSIEACYGIQIPNNFQSGQKINLNIYLKDQFGNKWISESSGYFDGIALHMWSNETKKFNWNF